MLSVICEVFGCTPSEAEAQDHAKIEQIFLYRNGARFIDLFRTKEGRDRLVKDDAATSAMLAIGRAGGYFRNDDQMAEYFMKDMPEDEPEKTPDTMGDGNRPKKITTLSGEVVDLGDGG